MASCSASSACSTMACEMAPCLKRSCGAKVGFVGELLVIHRFEIGIEGVGDVGTLHLEEQLAFFDVVVEAGLDVDDAAIGEGDDGNFARDVGEDAPGDVELGGDLHLLGGDKRELGYIVAGRW